jgi:O-acetyl-ADP-ribose deacetylase
MPARIGHDPPLFKTPDLDLLRRISGITPDPGATYVRLDQHGVRSTQRLALDDIGGSLLAGLFPAELKPQALYLYAVGRARAMLAAARAFGWSASPNPHLAFYTASPQQRLYLDARVDVDEYARRWQGEDRHWIGQHDAAEVRRTLWPWLIRRSYASASDEGELERFLRLLGRRDAHLRPGLRLVRTWDPDARRALGGSRELAAAVREAVNGVLTAAGEPELPGSSAR